MLTTLKNWWHQEEVCTQQPDLELAVTKLLVGMMSMDGEINSAEQKEVEHLLNVRFGFSEEESHDLVIQARDASRTDLAFSKVVKQIESNYSLQERADILSHVWRIALADGEVDFLEERYINRLSGLIGVSSEALQNLKSEQEKHLPQLNESKRFENPSLQNL
jgi:uncharacterized tellurite resistance protein B-like protein